ncbi:MAG: RAD55 family ATPase, partial [Myxococcales bacterium]
MKARRPAGPHPMPRVATGIEQLDIILRGGFLRGGSYIVAGSPGTGKTILGNQVGFCHAALGGKSVYISLLAESHGRMLSHISTMSFYDPEAIGQTIQYVSGYEPLREGGLKALLELIRKVVKRFGATLLVVDGIITAERAASSGEEFKVFVHELNVALTLLGCTALLLTNVLDD